MEIQVSTSFLSPSIKLALQISTQPGSDASSCVPWACDGTKHGATTMTICRGQEIDPSQGGPAAGAELLPGQLRPQDL